MFKKEISTTFLLLLLFNSSLGLAGENLTKKEKSLRTKRSHTRSCNAGDFAACSKVGDIKKSKKDIPEAKKFYLKSCNGGFMKGCFNLGALESAEGDLEKASLYYSLACEGRHYLASKSLV